MLISYTNISATNSNLIKCSLIYSAAVSQGIEDNFKFGMYNTYAILTPNYSSLNEKNILATVLLHIGVDSTQENGNITRSVLLADISSDNGKTLKQIGVYSKEVQTVRAKIAVLYTD